MPDLVTAGCGYIVTVKLEERYSSGITLRCSSEIDAFSNDSQSRGRRCSPTSSF